MELLHTVNKCEMIFSATDLINKLELLKEDAHNEALKLGYNPSQYIFKPNCSWDHHLQENTNKNKIKLIFTLEIYSKN